VTKKVFISYRRDGASTLAKRAAIYLRRLVPDNLVFLDTSSIQSGADFTQSLQRAVRESDLVLVLMGPDWGVLKGKSGENRLNDPADYVRLEVEQALSNRKIVVPMLLQGARLPSISDLPTSIQPLLLRQAVTTKGDDIEAGLDQVIKDHKIGIVELGTLMQTLRKYEVIAELKPNLRSKAEKAQQACSFRPYEELAGMIDLTISGDGRHFLAFTTAGIYHRSIRTDQLSSFRPYGRIQNIDFDERRSTLIVDQERWDITGTMEEEAVELVRQVVELLK
jgi:hypothetical protein